MKILSPLSPELLLSVGHPHVEPTKHFTKEIATAQKKIAAWGNVQQNGMSGFLVKPQQTETAIKGLGKSFQALCNLLAVHIEKTYMAQKEHFVKKAEVVPGASVWRKSAPMQHVGVYWPTSMQDRYEKLLPIVLAAKSAGCPNIHVFTMPDKDGKIHPYFLAALNLIGISTVYAVNDVELFAWLATGKAGFDSFMAWEDSTSSAAQLAISGVPYDVWLANCPQAYILLASKASSTTLFAKALCLLAQISPMCNVILAAPDEGYIEAVETALKDTLSDKSMSNFAEQAIKKSYAFSLKDTPDWQSSFTSEVKEWMVWHSDTSNTLNTSNLGHSIVAENIEQALIAEYLGWHTINLIGLSGTGHPLSISDFQRFSVQQTINAQAANLVWPLVNTHARQS